MKRGSHELISGILMEFALKTEEAIQNVGQGSQYSGLDLKQAFQIQVGSVIASVILLDGT